MVGYVPLANSRVAWLESSGWPFNNGLRTLYCLMSADSLEDLIARIRAFQESRALLTAVELDLFSAVGRGATAAEAASRLETDGRGTEMLMNALVALGMLQKKDGVFRKTRVSCAILGRRFPEQRALGHHPHRVSVGQMVKVD